MNKNLREIRVKAWKLKIEQWQSSGKSCLAWCREHTVSYKQFCYWKYRLLGTKNSSPEPRQLSFVELKPQKSQHAGIDIACGDFTITLHPYFDRETLLRTLAIMREVKC